MEAPPRPFSPLSWDLVVALRFMNFFSLCTLITGSLQCLIRLSSFPCGTGYCLTCTRAPGSLQIRIFYELRCLCVLRPRVFVTKSESLARSIPRSFLVRSLSDFAAGLCIDLLRALSGPSFFICSSGPRSRLVLVAFSRCLVLRADACRRMSSLSFPRRRISV